MELDEIILAAVAEDLGDGDHTSLATIPPGATGAAKLLVKQAGIISGVEVACRVFHLIDSETRVNVLLNDGTAVSHGDIVFTVEGRVQSLLRSERLVLNFMQRMSGIATQTWRYVEAVSGYPARILDTRKTTPNMRLLEKEAVRTGGGMNHRSGLFDMIMIKDNHVDFAGGIGKAIRGARAYLDRLGKDLKIEVEVRSAAELEEVLSTGGIDRIMLDNFSTARLAEAVRRIGGRYETEASGGITLENVREVAATGVDFISVGALTHQIRSLDLSLKAVK